MKKLFLSIIALAHFGAQAQWTNVPNTSLEDVSVGSATQVLGVALGYVKYFDPNTSTFSQANNLQNFVQVTIAQDGTAWARAGASDHYRALTLNGNSTNWTSNQLGLPVNTLSCRNAQQVVATSGAGTNGQPNVYTSNGTTTIDLIPGGGSLSQVSIGTDGTLFGIYGTSGVNNVYRHNGSVWYSIPGGLHQVSVGDATHVVGHYNGQPMYYNPATQSWINIAKPNGSNVTDIEVGADGTIYAISSEWPNNTYRASWVSIGAECLPISASVTLSGCSPFTYNGEVFTQSGTYTQTLQNALSCDSVLTINLTLGSFPPVTSSAQASICTGESIQFGSQTITASGEYTETFVLASGCDSIVTLTVSEPEAELTYDPNTMTLSGSSNLTGWSLLFSATVGGAGTEIATGNSSSFNQALTQSGTYEAVFGNDACGFGAVTLSSAGSNVTVNAPGAQFPIAANLSWTGNPNGVNGTFTSNPHVYTGVGNQSYSLIMVDANGCSETVPFTFPLSTNPFVYNSGTSTVACLASASLVVDILAVGVNEAATSNMSIYPNPASLAFTIDGLAAGSTISVMDAMGRNVMSTAVAGSRMEVSVANLSAGIYMVQVQEGNAIRTARLVVNN